MPPLLTADEVAAILRVSRAHVYAIRHRVGYVQLGRALRFKLEDVERFIASQARGTAASIASISVRALGEEPPPGSRRTGG